MTLKVIGWNGALPWYRVSPREDLHRDEPYPDFKGLLRNRRTVHIHFGALVPVTIRPLAFHRRALYH